LLLSSGNSVDVNAFAFSSCSYNSVKDMSVTFQDLECFVSLQFFNLRLIQVLCTEVVELVSAVTSTAWAIGKVEPLGNG